MKFNVLDHGYVEFIEAWGHGHAGREWPLESTEALNHPEDLECGIIEAARQSTQGSFRGWDPSPAVGDKPANPGDKNLLRRLYTNNPPHSTPFEFAGLVIEVQAPIMVFREWHRHRTQSYNEMSARYAPLPDLYYYPDITSVVTRAITAQKEKNKQAGAAVAVDINVSDIAEWLRIDLELSNTLEAHYQQGLSIGIPKELARKKMPVDHYSRMRASGNLRNWLAFLTLRMSPHAMFEIREYADAVAAIIEQHFPHTYRLWENQHVQS